MARYLNHSATRIVVPLKGLRDENTWYIVLTKVPTLGEEKCLPPIPETAQINQCSCINHLHSLQ